MGEKAKDPVCGMEVDKEKAFKARKEGKVYYFCSEHCKKVFLSGREKGKNHGGKEGHEHHHDHGGGHASHHAHMLRDFKKRFWISLAATIPVLVLSPLIQSVLGMEVKFPGDKYVLFAISSLVFFYGGWPFLKGLFDEVSKKQPGMMTLIGLAISVAYVYSSLVVFGLEGKVFFWELVTLVDVMLLGHWIEMRSVMGASSALEELVHLMPAETHLIKEDGSVTDVKVFELKEGNKVLIKPGEKIPADGKIIKGASEINESMITGESKPVEKQKDDTVIGGSINGTGSLTVKITRTGKDTYLSQMVKLVKEASESKSKTQNFADKAALWLTIIALSVGIITIFTWLLLGKEFIFALERMVTVMVITCPHALGLAIPLVIAAITGISARNGLLVRHRTPFENAWNLDMVVFDKTGTLTRGKFGVTDIISTGDWDEQELLSRAASVESGSEHTIAKSIVDKAKNEGSKFIKVDKFKAIPGKGAKATLKNEEIYVGNKKILELAGSNSAGINEKIEDIASQGKTIVLVTTRDKVQGIIGLADLIREESRDAVSKLKDMGLEVSMITGDNEVTAKHVAGQLGLDNYFAEVLPDRKAEKIKELQKQGKKVGMVGDGINDAPALAQADVGIAIGAGTDIAVETADIVLVENDPGNVVDIISLSGITRRKMKQNLGWATGYNVIAIPLAAGVLYNYGIVLVPAVGALVMSVSTVVVAINAKLISYGTEH